MRRYGLSLILFACCAFLAGCAYNPKITVYGGSGKPYVAPDLCAAIIACQQAKETDCLYNATTMISPQGEKEISSCKKVK